MYFGIGLSTVSASLCSKLCVLGKYHSWFCCLSPVLSAHSPSLHPDMQLFSLHLTPSWCQEHKALECVRSVGNQQLWWRDTAGKFPFRRTEVIEKTAQVKKQMQTTDLLWGKLLRDTPECWYGRQLNPLHFFLVFSSSYYGCFHTFSGTLPAHGAFLA